MLGAQVAEQAYIAVHVQPKASKSEVVGLETSGDKPEVRIRVTDPADKGKANKAVCRLVADALGLPKSAVRVASGETSRHKRLEVDAPAADAQCWIDSLPVLE